MSAFADPQIIELTKTKIIPVCTDDWYTRRRQDSEGEFFRSVGNQGPRKGEGGTTRQGIYVFTASGKLLSFKNNGGDAADTRDQISRAIAKFEALPDSERKPGAVTVAAPGPPDANYDRPHPKDGLIVRVNARILDQNKGPDLFARVTCDFLGGDKASRDFLWLTADESASIAPNNRKAGDAYELPGIISERIFRFHLIDNTRGEPEFWKKTDIRNGTLAIVVDMVEGDVWHLRLEGSALLSTDPDPATAKRGYEVKLHGQLQYNGRTKKWDKFDIAAVGDHWGRSTFTPGQRPGRTQLGVSFSLVTGDKPGDRIPPQGARDWKTYLGKE